MTSRRKFVGQYIEVRSAKGSDDIICCPKKNIPFAVRRNRIKRVMRDCLRKEGSAERSFIRVVLDPKQKEGELLRSEWQQYLLWKKRETNQ